MRASGNPDQLVGATVCIEAGGIELYDTITDVWFPALGRETIDATTETIITIFISGGETMKVSGASFRRFQPRTVTSQSYLYGW